MFVETEVCLKLLPIASAIPMKRFEKSARAASPKISVNLVPRRAKKERDETY